MKRILLRVLAVLLSVAGLLGVVAIATLIYGHVWGEEFAPDTFERREYSYFELPMVRLPVSSVTRRTTRPDLEQALVDKKYVVPSTPPKRWDLVVAYRRAKQWREGDARILCQYLDASDDQGECFWMEWTADHAAMAKIFWPEIVKLAHDELYFFVPEMFAVAETARDPAQLQRDLNHVLARNYEQLANTEKDLKNLETAVRFYSEALSHEPDRPDSLAGRARRLKALGRSGDAEKDRERIIRAEDESGK